MTKQLLEGMTLRGEMEPHHAQVLNDDSLAFLAKLHRQFNHTRLSLLQQRIERQKLLDQGKLPDFLAATASIRNDLTWKIAPTPEDLQKRWVEITGPTDRKMMINALNSGANIFMADFEDSNSPTWHNIIEGQLNLHEAIESTLTFTSPEGKQYALKDHPAVLVVRPRGWHLPEKHLLIDGEPISASLFDFGLSFFHNAKKLIQKGSGPYFYLPKLESHNEARLWNDVFIFAQEALGIPQGTIRATVLIETILAVFEMEEILFELKEHCAGLNAGRWDYIFSIIKKFKKDANAVLPDRDQITMTVPFMRAYTDLLVRTCHKRGAHAMGGMAAFIPSRKDKEINENALLQVREDKLRELKDGFDGTWVAHPDLVPIAMEVFQKGLGSKANQKERTRDDIKIVPQQLLDFRIPGGKITEKGLRHNINVALQYLDSWLRGIGAAAIFNLMEDAATAEISRAQVWQWVHQPLAILDDGRKVTEELYKQIVHEELDKIKKVRGETIPLDKLERAKDVLNQLIINKTFIDFLTLIAYDYL